MAQFCVINAPLAFTVQGDMRAKYRVQEGPRKSQKVLEIIILFYERYRIKNYNELKTATACQQRVNQRLPGL